MMKVGGSRKLGGGMRALAAGVSSAPPISCAYALNGDVTPAGFTQLTVSGGGQTVGYTVPSGNSPEYAAAPDGYLDGTSAKINSDANVVAIGLGFAALPATVAGQSLRWMLELRDPGTLAVLKTLLVQAYDGQVDIYINDSDGSTAFSLPAVGNVTALYLVADAGNSRLRFFYAVGAAVTQVDAVGTYSYTPGKTFAVVRAQSSDSVGSLLGTALSANLLTSATDLSALTGNGYVDNCGNAI